jgi:hypothetical protein
LSRTEVVGVSGYSWVSSVSVSRRLTVALGRV